MLRLSFGEDYLAFVTDGIRSSGLSLRLAGSNERLGACVLTCSSQNTPS
jgi:hypothetical protein